MYSVTCRTRWPIKYKFLEIWKRYHKKLKKLNFFVTLVFSIWDFFLTIPMSKMHGKKYRGNLLNMVDWGMKHQRILRTHVGMLHRRWRMVSENCHPFSYHLAPFPIEFRCSWPSITEKLSQINLRTDFLTCCLQFWKSGLENLAKKPKKLTKKSMNKEFHRI